jgi:hypothetical protein
MKGGPSRFQYGGSWNHNGPHEDADCERPTDEGEVFSVTAGPSFRW